MPQPIIDEARGLGVEELALAITERRPPRVPAGDMPIHVLEVMEAIHRAAESGRRELVSSRCEPPDPLPERTPYRRGPALGNE
jgi:hypothetical protein